MTRTFRQVTQTGPLQSVPHPTQSQIIKVAQEVETPSPFSVPRSVFSNLIGEKRASSVLLPNGLAPLVIPNSSTDLLPAQAYLSLSPTVNDEDRPPKVPPKSPKTLIRAFPQPRKVRETPTSAGSPFSISHTANSSVTSFSTVDSRNSPKPWTSPVRGRSPLSTQNFADASNEAPRRLSRRKQSEPTLFSERPNVHHVQTQVESSPRSRFVANTGHQRAESEASILNRARPMRRGDMTLQRGLSRNMMLQEPVNLPTNELPQGMLSGMANEKLTACEIRRLKHLAELNIRDFRVLNETEVSSMTKELRQLDERCQYLQIFHASLREGKCDLHDRIVGVLKSPRTATFSREHLIKQEEALLDLDISINEWLMKLNAAESRRQKVQRKLLEHTAAIIHMTGPSSPCDGVSGNQQTPPRSPQRIDFSPERRGVESIRVYADSGVASLLASIEQEIDVLAESTRYGGN